jgi:GNAT superfamily N-acetyltransferase
MAKLRIRRAALADVSEIVKLLDQEHKDAPLDLPPIDYEKATHHILHVLFKGIVFMLGQEVNGKTVITGTMGLQLGSPWYSGEVWISDAWLYVKPKYRSYPAFKTLVSAAIAVAEERQLPLSLGNLTGHDPDRMDRLYERMDLHRVGSQFVRRIQ